MEDLHIRFEFSIEPMSDAMQRIMVQGLGQFNASTNCFSQWPVKEQWQSYMEWLAHSLHCSLPESEKATIETALTEVESQFNQRLKQGPLSREQLQPLLKSIEELKVLVCDRNIAPHATYPYFARWFTLHLAILAALVKHEENEAKSMGLRVWKQAFAYLQSAAQSAYGERSQQIEVKKALLNGYYVFDNWEKAPLSEIVTDTRGGGKAYLLCDYAQARLSKQYVLRLHFDDGFEILESAKSGMAIQSESPISAEQVAQARMWWNNYIQTLMENEAGKYRFVQSTEGANNRVEPAALRQIGTREYSLSDLFKALARDLIGELPIPGMDYISTITGYLINWIVPGTDYEKLWKAIIEAIEEKIREALEAQELNNINNNVTAAEKNFDFFLNDFEKSPVPPEEQMPPELVSVLTSVLNQCTTVGEIIFKPNAGPLASLGYFQRYFLLHLTALGIAKFYLTDLDIDYRIETLYKDINDYFEAVRGDVRSEADRDTQIHEHSGCGADKYVKVIYRHKSKGDLLVGEENQHSGTDSKGYQLKVREKAYIAPRVHLIKYSKVVYDQCIRNTSTIMEQTAEFLDWWDAITPAQHHEENTLPSDYNRRRNEWNALVNYRQGTNFDKPLREGFEEQNDSQEAYLDPESLPETGLDP